MTSDPARSDPQLATMNGQNNLNSTAEFSIEFMLHSGPVIQLQFIPLQPIYHLCISPSSGEKREGNSCRCLGFRG